MATSTPEHLFRLPGPAAAVDRVATALGQGQSSVVLAGPFIDPRDLCEALLTHPAVQNLVVLRVHAAEGEAPERQLSDELGGLDVELLLAGGDADCPPGQLVRVQGLDDLGPEWVSRWYGLIGRLATVGQSARSMDRYVPGLLLCHQGHPDVAPPGTNVLLHVNHMHRQIDELDMRCLVRVESGHASDTQTSWREHVLPALAGPDSDLVERLWKVCLREVSEVVEECRRLARSRAWTAAPGVDVAGRSAGQTFADEMRGRVFRNMNAPAREHLLYAVARGDSRQVERRLWRGQTALLLPIIDTIRLWLCEELQDRLGGGWPLRWERPQSAEEEKLVSQSYLHCQLGHLNAVIRKARPLGDREALLDLVWQTKALRNELAHYRPVNFGAYEQLMACAQKLDVHMAHA